MPKEFANQSTEIFYYSLLESKLRTEAFYIEMMRLISKSPYFFASYIEISDYLESLGLVDEQKSFLRFAFKRVQELLSDKQLIKSIVQTWTKNEAEYAVAILRKYQSVFGVSFVSMYATFSVKVLQSSLPEPPFEEAKNLRLMTKVSDISKLEREVAENEMYWTYDTSRQDGVLFHQRTNAIVLRTLSTKTEKYIPTDGPHESVRTPLSQFFPHVLEVVENFAQQNDGGLGRVAIVRLKPHSRVYRHYDPEPWLRGRDRYHLVILSRKGSFMTSGVEKTTFYKGDVFFFDNKKMHTAENDSDDWRVHVIFDMKVQCG